METGSSINKLYKVLYSLIGNKKVNMIQDGFSDDVMANMISDFLIRKLRKLSATLKLTVTKALVWESSS